MKRKAMYLILITLLLSACGQITISVAPTETPGFVLPDLVVTFINVAMVDRNGRCAGGYQVFASIMNQGNAPADNVTALEISSGSTVVISRLEAGQTMDLQMPAVSTAGPYIINVDPQDLIPESNETNNNLSFLLPTPTPYIGCNPSITSNLTPVPSLPTPLPVNTEGLIYADMNAAQIFKVTRDAGTMKLVDASHAQFSPNLEFAVVEQSGDLWLFDIRNTIMTNLTNTPDDIEWNPQWWQANPSKIVFNVVGVNESQEKGWRETYAGYVATISTDGTEYLRLAESPSYGRFALSPDGVTIAFDTGGFPYLYVIGLGLRSFPSYEYGSLAAPAKGSYFFSPSFSPDGQQLTWWVGRDETQIDRLFGLEVFDLAGRTNRVIHSYSALGGTLGWLESPLWSPSGSWIAFQTRGETTPQDLWIINQDGNMGQRFGLATNPVWSWDSQHLAFVQWPPRADSNLTAAISIVEVPSWSIFSPVFPAGSVPLAWIVPAPTP